MGRSLVAGAVAVAVVVAAALATAAAGPAQAQSKTGTAIGTFMLIEPSARIAGMGNAGAPMDEGLQAVFYNPAALGMVETRAAEFTHAAWIEGIDYNHAAAAFPVPGLGIVYAGVTALNSGAMDVRTVEQPLGTGEQFSVSDLAIGLGYARRVTDRFSTGVQVKYAQETIWHSSLKVAVFDFGTLYRVSEHGLRLGASIVNFGTRGRFDGRDLRILFDSDPSRFGNNGALPAELLTDAFAVPILFRVGLGVPRQVGRNGRLWLAVEGTHPSDNTESINTGGEFTYRDVLSLRAGYQNLLQKDSEVGWTFGAGVKGKFQDLAYLFDYALADQGRLDMTHRFTLGITF